MVDEEVCLVFPQRLQSKQLQNRLKMAAHINVVYVFLLVLLFVQDKRPCGTTKLFYPSYGFNHVVANGGITAHDNSYSVVDFKINYNQQHR